MSLISENRFLEASVGRRITEGVFMSSAQLTSFLARTRRSQVVPNGSTHYRSASNSLLDRTADRTPKTFALQGDPSRPTQHPSSKRSPYIVFSASRDVTWNDLAHSWRIFSPNRDIEKIPAPLRSHISSRKSPNLSPSLSRKSGVRTWLLSVISYFPCKTLFPTIRLTLLGSDFPCL
ncbi:hypothetical protein AVEN_30451-1 [Araneus ventricosus]|uniref:Uncharacterized protein n=1 Tax=Araneus ventricosus TaxID=182803 RepID=A0A4Y2TQE8_ARAVE|nr:hypothetical protein AVEN_245107-1 [Araneus ventricosus]GBO02312.1 hypothetical protein AVEN_30451-1 [Araneus ventricosus]